MQIQWPKHQLSIRAEHKPEIATEGEMLTVTYRIKNVGSNLFPGGTLTIFQAWSSTNQNVGITDTIKINHPLEPNGEFSSDLKKYVPLLAGHTLFFVVNAIANDEQPVELYLISGRRLWPPLVQPYKSIFHVVRTLSHEEVSRRKELRIVIYSLAILIMFQVANWFLRWLMKV